MLRPAVRLRCESLEDRTTPTAIPVLATGAATGSPPTVTAYDAAGQPIALFLAYDAAFTGGVNVAVGDVTGDGVPDIVTAPKSGGGSNIRVFDGSNFSLVNSFYAFDPSFTGGVSLATANVTADEPFSVGDDIIVGAGAGGGPQVAVFRGGTGELVKSFYAFDPAFAGGVNVAAASGIWIFSLLQIPLYPPGVIPSPLPPPPPPSWTSGTIVVGAGAGGAPHVKRLNADTLDVQQSFYAYDSVFRGGVNVAIDSRTIDTFSDTPTPNPPDDPVYLFVFQGDVIVTGAGDGGGPNVKVFAEYGFESTPVGFGEAASFYAGADTETRGVRVELNGNQFLAYTEQLDGPTAMRSYSFSLSGRRNQPSTASVTDVESTTAFLGGSSFGSLARLSLPVAPSILPVPTNPA